MQKRLPPLTRVDKVISRILEASPLRVEVEEVHVDLAAGRISAEDVHSTLDMPPYDRSAVDGYAVRAEDTFGASDEDPVTLEVIGKIGVGEAPRYTIGEGQCVEVATGAPIPPGADAVVMIEHTKREGQTIQIYRAVAPYENVSRRGEDFRKGEIIVRKGEILKPWHLAAIASTGTPKVRVYRRVRAAVFSTGDELLEIGSPLTGVGKVYASTKTMVSTYLRELGLEVEDLGIVGDDIGDIVERILYAMRRGVDFLFITGGTSVGERDYTVRAIEEAGGEIVAHGIAIKPGRPLAIAMLDRRIVMALSGLPVAALVELELVFKPVYYRLLGAKEPPTPTIKGRLTRRVNVEPGIRGYVRVRVCKRNGAVLVEPLALTGSGVISSLLRANGVLLVPEEVEGYDEGDEVEVILTGRVEEG